MTLTTVVGSSGSGKTTFLNDVHASHHAVYIRQYHNIRPYVTVTSIPNFDPSSLPYWDIYEKEGKADSIKVGGTMAGEFTAGLSGGQRKLLLFELIYQRTMNQKKLLLVLDEPFAGVTDDFVPWIIDRLNLMRKTHNILLVTNDHVEALTKMADNTITVSAIDRTKVKINEKDNVDREMAIHALSLGDAYKYTATKADLKFFWDVEVWGNPGILGVVAFTTFAFSLFLASFWDSADESAALVLIAGGIIAFFAINPYLLSLVDWRNYMNEEAEALLHSSKGMNKFLKTLLSFIMILLISLVQFGMTVAVVDGLDNFKFWLAMFFDSASMTFPFLCFGLYTMLPTQAVQTLASMPFLFMIFFSTTFSPGSGVAGLKELRYLFARFYFWCMVPGYEDAMEGCPADESLNIFYMCIVGMLGVFLFLIFMGLYKMFKAAEKSKASKRREELENDAEFEALQLAMYGERQLRKLQHFDSTGSIGNTLHSNSNDIVPAELDV